jgi:hypothetical protein
MHKKKAYGKENGVLGDTKVMGPLQIDPTEAGIIFAK